MCHKTMLVVPQCKLNLIFFTYTASYIFSSGMPPSLEKEFKCTAIEKWLQSPDLDQRYPNFSQLPSLDTPTTFLVLQPPPLTNTNTDHFLQQIYNGYFYK